MRIISSSFICKPLENGMEDIIQCQRNLQEIHLQSQRKLSDLELKMDNANVNNEAQLHQLKREMTNSKCRIRSSQSNFMR
uniref:Uncharacterized protein n=1 Tax=Cucumis melo TaxID=3656 RepID=A0A9I9EID2_CUCME